MYRAIAKNKRNTVVIILLFLLIIGGLGVLAGYVYGWSISWVVISIAVAYAAIQYFAASRLAISSFSPPKASRILPFIWA